MRKYKINLSSALAYQWPAICILHSVFADNIKESWKKHFTYSTETLWVFFSLCLLTVSFYHAALSCTSFGDGLSQIFPVAFESFRGRKGVS